MKRRDFITLVGGAAAWPMAARAQAKIPEIGFLATSSPGPSTEFRGGLMEAGYIEGRNVKFRFGSANQSPEQVARELVSLQVTVLVVNNTSAALAAKATTKSIPIVFSIGADPVEIGLVASLGRPGGNVTGVTFLANTLGSKRLGLLRQLVPAASSFGFLIDPTNPNAEPETADMQGAAHLSGYTLLVVRASTAKGIDEAFTSLTQQRIDALAVAGHAFFGAEEQQLAELALRHRLPTIYGFRSSAAAGGLMSYGGRQTEAYRQQGILVARILKGAKPADLPVQQVTRFELVINLKAAKALGLTVPPTLLAIADEVIE